MFINFKTTNLLRLYSSPFRCTSYTVNSTLTYLSNLKLFTSSPPSRVRVSLTSHTESSTERDRNLTLSTPPTSLRPQLTLPVKLTDLELDHPSPLGTYHELIPSTGDNQLTRVRQ